MLTGSASAVNVKRSLDKYVYDSIGAGGEGFNVDWEGLPFDDSAPREWVQPRILDLSAEYVRQSSGVSYGEQANILFHINIFVKKSGVTTTDRHFWMRDRIAQYFRVGEDIDLSDYIATSASVDNMRVRRIITDSSMPETHRLFQYAIAWEIDYTRETTEA